MIRLGATLHIERGYVAHPELQFPLVRCHARETHLQLVVLLIVRITSLLQNLRTQCALVWT